MSRSNLWVAITTLLLAGIASAASPAARPTHRADSLKLLCQRLGVGRGAVVADVGSGNGADSIVFASIVGPEGTVLSEEIEASKVQEVLKRSLTNQCPQVVPILGDSEDPRLPNGSADLIYMHLVFHHFAHPREMLRHLWFDLKPGGYLVIVDERKGPLTDWTATESREKQHHWTGETTVVRQARETGFLFHDVLDDLWNAKNPFVLVFRRPLKGNLPPGDPEAAGSLDAKATVRGLPLPKGEQASLLFFGLDRGRELLPVLRGQLKPTSTLFDAVLEEWPVVKDELPTPSVGGNVKVVRTEKGDLQVPAGSAFDTVIFADAYHRIYEPTKLLARLRQSLAPGGVVVIIDRKGPDGEARRLAGHHRRISPALVRLELQQAGFEPVKAPKSLGADRFALAFRLPGAKPGER